ncbi:MAG: CheY-like chemotaxis protein [Myxococcota bacterium]|jgi:CheY-like chemotaxis protein
MNQPFKNYRPMNARWARNDRAAANRVLVVQADPAMRAMLAETVAAAGADLFEVHTGCEALDVLAAGFRGAVILDGNLPDADGLTVLARIRTMDPSLPVIYATDELARGRAKERALDDAFAFCDSGELLACLPTLLVEALNAMGRDAVSSQAPAARPSLRSVA